MRKVFIIIFIAYLAINTYFLFSKGDSLMDIQNKGFVVWVSTALGVKPDKTLHMMLFFPMIPLAWFAFRPKWDITKVIILWSGVIFGVLTEWIQHYLPHRTGDITDVAADIEGSVLGIPLLLFFSLFKRK